MAISTAAKQIVIDNMDVVAAGGQDSISMVQTPEMRVAPDRSLIAMHKDVYMPMLQTAGVVAKRFGIARDAMRSEEHTSELQSLMRISYAVFCLKKKTTSSIKD